MACGHGWVEIYIGLYIKFEMEYVLRWIVSCCSWWCLLLYGLMIDSLSGINAIDDMKSREISMFDHQCTSFVFAKVADKQQTRCIIFRMKDPKHHAFIYMAFIKIFWMRCFSILTLNTTDPYSIYRRARRTAFSPSSSV